MIDPVPQGTGLIHDKDPFDFIAMVCKLPMTMIMMTPRVRGGVDTVLDVSDLSHMIILFPMTCRSCKSVDFNVGSPVNIEAWLLWDLLDEVVGLSRDFDFRVWIHGCSPFRSRSWIGKQWWQLVPTALLVALLSVRPSLYFGLCDDSVRTIVSQQSSLTSMFPSVFSPEEVEMFRSASIDRPSRWLSNVLLPSSQGLSQSMRERHRRENLGWEPLGSTTYST